MEEENGDDEKEAEEKMNLKPYPKYKDSGIEWLGEVPEHWTIRKFKRSAWFQEGPGLRNWQFTDSGIRVICVTNITEMGINFSNYQKFIDQDEYGKEYKRFTVDKGDLLLSSSGNSWGKVAEFIYDETVILNTSTIRINVLKKMVLNRNIIKWVLQSQPLREQLGLMMTGACQPNFGPSHLGEAIVSVPDLDEQNSIASFLDRETEKIDSLIANKEKQIELLKEKRQALISHAVTKGLGPDVKMKDSGVEWLGEIPEHWEKKKVKHMTRILRGKFTHRPRNDPRMYDGPYPFIQTGDVVAASKYIREYHQTLSEEGLAVSKMFPKGMVVMTIAANIGDMAIMDFEACFPDSVVGFVPKSDVALDYLYYLFIGMRSAFLSMATLNTQLNLNIDRIGSVMAAQPPLGELHAIVEHLETQVKEMNKLEVQVNISIMKFREYRTALISAAVTGKIDVRGDEG